MSDDHQSEGFGELEAQSLFCPRCGQAQPVRLKLLLVLPGGEKYAYYCRRCGEELGTKLVEARGRSAE